MGGINRIPIKSNQKTESLHFAARQILEKRDYWNFQRQEGQETLNINSKCVMDVS